ncbi:MAG TPA: FAD-binding oxidoreductase [Ktedonobacterales bacterium]|nr:FAD-binding oxidoreductase [Ktedonobacterales bacterium]
MRPVIAATLLSALRDRFGEAARPAETGDEVAGAQPVAVVEPRDTAEVSALLSFADAEGLKVLIRGGGAQLDLGFPPAGGDILLSTRALTRVIDYTANDQTITVETGMPLVALQAALAPADQWFALDPALPEQATMGGVVSTNASGARRLRYGGVRDQLLGVQVVLADGTVARGGGKVVKNVAGYDLPKLYVGALGTLGVVTAVSLRVYPRPSTSRTVIVRCAALGPLSAAAGRVLGATLTPTSLDMLDARLTEGDSRYTLAARFESRVDESVAEQSATCVALMSAEDVEVVSLSGDEEASLWRDMDARAVVVSHEREARIKVSVPPTEIAGWLAAFEALTGAQDVVLAGWRAHMGHGLVFARMVADAPSLVHVLERLRAEAMERRGSLVLESARPDLAERFDVWGPSPALELMRRVKTRFDPNNTLNPGRFIGRL